MRDGEVVIAKRPNTQKWQMRIKMPDVSWKHQSTKTADLDLAKKVATEIYDDIRWSIKKGLPLETEREFNDAAEIYAKQLRNSIEAGTAKPVDPTHLDITNTHIIPFFRGAPLSSVDDEKYEAYKNWLPEKMGKKEIAKSTYNSHNVVLRAIFDIARRKKRINSGKILKITVKGIGRKPKRRPKYRDHVCSYDFVRRRTDDGKVFRTLNILDEHSRECLAIRVKRKLNSTDVIYVLTDLFILHGVPAFIRSDNGPEFVAQAVRDWIAAVGAKTAHIVPGSPWQNGYCESFNAYFRDELLNSEIFYSLKEAQIIIEEWRKHYNTKRPHSALGYRPPAPETIVPMETRPVMH